MSTSPPTSVLLPTVRWTTACNEVADQLTEDDELLVVCDRETDPIAGRRDDLPENVRLVVAGDPVDCSGKANAIAVGMEAARHDRLVWTDDDFHHPPDWLATLHADYERHGPASELPFFVGTDSLSNLMEPIYAVTGTLGVYFSDTAWGGAVIFERDDLDVAAFLADLRRTVSDDGLLSEYLAVTSIRRVRRVEIGGTIPASLERHVRFTQIVYRHEPRGMHISIGVMAVFAVLGLFTLIYAGGVFALVAASVYAWLGVRRWTALLAYPSLLAAVPLLTYALARRTFVWGGRRYRWHDKFDCEVVDRSTPRRFRS